MRSAGTLVILTGNYIRETDKATYFEVKKVNGTPIPATRTWIPLSQTQNSFRDPKTQDTDTLTITEWIANAKGLLGLEHHTRTSAPKETEVQGTSMSIKTHMDSYSGDDDDFPF